ncbi:MAG: cellulase family glycosylhydrolase [Euryarchaeota archaeon]|nr:cellulase family glycosylhydrolase [Euryarchaeota archaeon]
MSRRLVLFLALVLLSQTAGAVLSPLHAQGTRFMDGEGRVVVLRGVNLGSWLMVEMWISNMDFGGLGSNPLNETPLYETLTRRFGVEGRERLLDTYRENWVSGADLRRIREMGFNAVRIPVSYRLLEEDGAPGYREAGWRFLDRAVEWCRDLDIYCILDLHRASGGHTGVGISEVDFWRNESHVARTEALWGAIARRYRDRPEVAGYDLLNEPFAAPSPEALIRVYDRLYRAIRQADSQAIVFMEPPLPFGRPEQLPDPRTMGWENVAYSWHPYAVARGWLPVLGLAWMRAFEFPAWAEAQRRWQVPLFAGEVHCVGVDTTAAPGPLNGDLTSCFDGLLESLDDRGWSWALWNVKYVRGNPGSLFGLQTREIPGRIRLETEGYDGLQGRFREFNTSRGFSTPRELERVLLRHLPGG